MSDVQPRRFWYPIKSHAKVYTNLLKELGVKGVQVEEMKTLPEKLFHMYGSTPVYGFLFIFRRICGLPSPGQVVTDEDLASQIYFTRSVANNASGTQVIINMLLNLNTPDVDIGRRLAELKEISMPLDQYWRTYVFANSVDIMNIHNRMSEFAHLDLQNDTEGNKADHFVGFIALNGRVYELDSGREGPMDLGPILPGQNWWSLVYPTVKFRSHIYNACEYHNKFMVLTGNTEVTFERQYRKHQSQMNWARINSGNLWEDIDTMSMCREFANMYI